MILQGNVISVTQLAEVSLKIQVYFCKGKLYTADTSQVGIFRSTYNVYYCCFLCLNYLSFFTYDNIKNIFPSIDFSQIPCHSQLYTAELFPVLGSFAIQFEDHLQSGDYLRPESNARLYRFSDFRSNGQRIFTLTVMGVGAFLDGPIKFQHSQSHSKI